MAWFDVYIRQGQRWVFRKRVVRSDGFDILVLKKELSTELGEQPGEILAPENIKIVKPVELQAEEKGKQ